MVALTDPLYMRLYVEDTESDWVEAYLMPGEVPADMHRFSVEQMAKWLRANHTKSDKAKHVDRSLDTIFGWHHRIRIGDEVYGPIIQNKRIVRSTLDQLALTEGNIQNDTLGDDEPVHYLEMRAFPVKKDEVGLPLEYRA